jgi:protein TonB
MLSIHTSRHVRLAVFPLVVIACAQSSSNVQTSPDVPAGIIAPRVIHKVNPVYPAELRKEGVTGTVTIQATIDKTGRLLEPNVVRSADHRLDELALAAVRKWVFKPGTINGEPADVLYLVDVSFSIP